MAKSIRAKAKMAARKKKRESGNYHAADAARVARLSARLLGKDKVKKEEIADGEEEEEVVEDDEEMKEEEPKVSTSAPRDTRRENWRESKGMTARPKIKGLNKQGRAAGRHKAGKTKRRR